MTTPTVTELHVGGMTCNNCARKVIAAAQSVPGVHSITLSLPAESASVRWNSGPEKNPPAVIDAIARAGFDAREIAATTGGPSKQRHWQWPLLLGLAATLILMAGEWGFHLSMTPWFRWTAFALAGGVQIFSGRPFYAGAWRQIKVGQSTMDTLVALGSTTAFGYSVWALFGHSHGHLYFMESAAIISLVSAGHWLEARVSDQAGGALKALLHLAPQTARRLQSPSPKPTSSQPINLKKLSFSEIGNRKSEIENEVEVAVSSLRIGDRIALRPGDRVPVDATVLEGESAVDEAMLTGESVPVDKKAGSSLFAGTLNMNGRLTLRVTATGESTALAHIIAAVQRAQSSRAQIQRLGDRISNVFVPVIVAIALGAGIYWAFASGAEKAFVIASGILIVACPCAMGLATPAAIMASANAAARRGILIRDGIALEKAGTITAIILDKTGTLTDGELTLAGPWIPPENASLVAGSPAATASVSQADATHNVRIQQVQNLAGSLARSSNHPLSRVLARQAKSPIDFENWNEIPGSGLQGEVPNENGRLETVRLGSLPWLQDCGIPLPEGEAQIEHWKADGATLVGLSKGETLIGLFALQDGLKKSAAAVVGELQRQGLKTYLLTGDNPRTAAAIARQVGIPPSRVFAEVRPEEKSSFVKTLQAQGERVAFVGDGINDAPALTQADLGIAVSRASDIAQESADIILLKTDIEAVPEALGLARATLRTIKQNLFWAFFYNALGVPLAAAGIISPIFCAAAMGFSDLIVIGNALRLLRWRKR